MVDRFVSVLSCLITKIEIYNWKKTQLQLNHEQVMVYFCFCNNKNGLKVTLVTNPYISLAVIKLFSCKVNVFRQEGHVCF